MDILIEVNGIIDAPEGLSADRVCSRFIDWIESKGWCFGGGFRDGLPIHFGGTVYSLERALTEEEVESALRAWFRELGWTFDGSFRAVVDDS